MSMREWDAFLFLPECFLRKIPNLPLNIANCGELFLEGMFYFIYIIGKFILFHYIMKISLLIRFNDISVAIRTKCVQYSMHFLLNHPELRQDVTETLKLRQHDAEESVRYVIHPINYYCNWIFDFDYVCFWIFVFA